MVDADFCTPRNSGGSLRGDIPLVTLVFVFSCRFIPDYM